MTSDKDLFSSKCYKDLFRNPGSKSRFNGEFNPNCIGGGGRSAPCFLLLKIKVHSTAVITLYHLSKLLFFDLLSFPLVLSDIKTVSRLLRKSNLIVLRGGGKSAPTKNRNYEDFFGVFIIKFKSKTNFMPIL